MSCSKARAQIIQVAEQSLVGTPYGSEWIAGSARLVLVGGKPKGSGFLQVSELGDGSIQSYSEIESDSTLRCVTLGTEGIAQQTAATGDIRGELQLWSLTRQIESISSCRAHHGMINSIAGCSNIENSEGWLIATGGEDGYIKIWDPRQIKTPLASFPPQNGTSSKSAECWTVAFGNAHSKSERCILAGFSNGDLQLYDLDAGSQRWQTNVGSGIVSASFDREDIDMNKFAAACMDSSLHMFDARTQHPETGFASHREVVPGDSSLWGCIHLPQHREISMTMGGNGSLRLFKYSYPERRRVKDTSSLDYKGVAGKLEGLSELRISEQPISSFAWNQGKTGLFCCTALDQMLRIGLVTKLHLL